MSLDQLVEIETKKIELQDLFAIRRHYIEDLRISSGRGSAHMRICLNLTVRQIEETKKIISELETKL